MSVDLPASDETAGNTKRDPIAHRILAVLEACAVTRKPVTITELVEATGLAKSTVHRMCWKLEEIGLLEHADSGFLIGTKLLVLANANPVVSEIRAEAIPCLLDLQRLTGASQLAILTGRSALVVDGMYTRQTRAHTLIGVGLPLHCTAVGKAILATVDRETRERLLGQRLLPAMTNRSIILPVMIRRHLDRIAESGVAVSNEEFQPGIVGVAAAFRVRRSVTAAIGCVGGSTDHVERRSRAHVVAAARELQRLFDRRVAEEERLHS